nr:unnamed protein product [Callosobruchus chinensis]
MKNELKKKTDMKATGNKKTILKDWERKLLDIIDNDDTKPTLHKIPGAATIGLNPLENVAEMPKPAETRHVSIRPPLVILHQHQKKVSWKGKKVMRLQN